MPTTQMVPHAWRLHIIVFGTIVSQTGWTVRMPRMRFDYMTVVVVYAV
jgi:hypothetical protein